MCNLKSVEKLFLKDVMWLKAEGIFNANISYTMYSPERKS